jgi:DNA replication protein DnaC
MTIIAELAQQPVDEECRCEKHNLNFTKKTMRFAGRYISTECPKCLEEKKAEIKQREEADERQALEKHIPAYIENSINSIGIPKRYQAATLENYVASSNGMSKAKRTCEAYVSKFESCYKNGTSLIFCGNVGTGKTHLAIATAKEIVKQYQNIIKPIDKTNKHKISATIGLMQGYKKQESIALLANALDILRDVKSTYSTETNISERDVINRYVDAELLVVDEVGVQYGTDADKIILFDILNRRYQDVKPTILISNLSLPELKVFIGERVIDRMREANGAVIDFSWESYRGEK